MTTLTVIYTQHLYGELDRLPRLATAIARQRREAEGRVLLFDLGDACAPNAEECTLTDGRAAPIVLDAIGYDAVNVRGYLSDAARAQLRANYLNVALADDEHSIVMNGVAFADVPPDAHPHWLHIALDTATATQLSPEPTLNTIHTLSLATVTAEQLGIAVIERDGDTVKLFSSDVVTVPATTRADATIAGAVEFVRDEVRYLKKMRGR